MSNPSGSNPFKTLWDGKKAPADDVAGNVGELYGVTYSIGTESNDTANVITVEMQLTDFFGVNLAAPAGVMAFIADDAAGITAGTAHSTSPAIEGGIGVMRIVTTDVCWHLTSEADGTINIDFEDSGTQTVYLVLVMPDGRFAISDAITHAA